MTNLVIISGLSGSGKSTAVKVLEDLGYYCVDNIPPTLLPNFIELCENSDKGINQVALVIDIREKVSFDSAPSVIEEFKNKGYPVDMIFLESSDAALVKRYKETRRKHPLSDDGDIQAGISKERKMLEKLKEISNYTIDTSELNVHDLSEIIKNKFNKPSSQNILINIISFGFKHGIPNDADMIFDVRFLPNPHFVDGLRELTGVDPKVAEYVMSKEETQEFIEKITSFLDYLIPNYEKEGKSYLTIAIGCTGGKHRSVAIAEKLTERYNNLSPVTRHRDISKI
ncbi:MAG: RNase adapter RapZ [Thermodesulfobacteriota bacterium]